jgi:predicted DNA-binding transcriptional regulator AlpA
MSTSIGNDAEAILVDHEDLERLGVKFSNAWLLKLEQRGDFPRRLSIGGRKTVWLLSEVKAAITRAAERRDASAAERRRIVRGAGAARHGGDAS